MLICYICSWRHWYSSPTLANSSRCIHHGWHQHHGWISFEWDISIHRVFSSNNNDGTDIQRFGEIDVRRKVWRRPTSLPRNCWGSRWPKRSACWLKLWLPLYVSLNRGHWKASRHSQRLFILLWGTVARWIERESRESLQRKSVSYDRPGVPLVWAG